MTSTLSARFICTIFGLLAFSNMAQAEALQNATSAQTSTSAPPAKTVEEVMKTVNTYCGACHEPPSPALLPKRSWPNVIYLMNELATKRMGSGFFPKDVLRDINAFYYGSAPEELTPLPYFTDEHSPIVFELKALSAQATTPLVTNIHQVELFADHVADKGNEASEFLVSDGGLNQVILLSRVNQQWQEQVIMDVPMPSDTEVLDYDGDGDKDLLIAALGSMSVKEITHSGQIILLRQNDQGRFTQEVLVESVGRISDANPMDLDGDGDLDIVYAEFGANEKGELAWLENRGNGEHVKHSLINLSGGLNLTPVDFNNDGKTDLLSFITQEHELLVALVNNGNGDFESRVLFKAGHPMVGLTAVEFVDLDKDGDQDVLFTNGDANDTQTDPKPYHGVQWLENKGDFVLAYHGLGRFYGAAGVQAGDMDGDGDLDVVASSWNNYWDDEKRQSLIWFENDGKQNFTRHNISNQPHSIVTLQLADVTGDKRLDIIAGVFRMDLLTEEMKSNGNKEGETMKPRIVIFENQPRK